MNINHPMGAARLVRRDRYAFPGGYPLVLITTDSGTLCPDCVRDCLNFYNRSSGHNGLLFVKGVIDRRGEE